MDSYLIRNRLNMPIVTGTPALQETSKKQRMQEEGKASFQDVLTEQLTQNSRLTFSKHAVSRVQERSIELTESSIARLNEGVRIAQEKGLDDTLIIVDKTAFIVSIKNNTVITTLGGNDLKGNAITNINGTVIV